jgi:replication factor A1
MNDVVKIMQQRSVIDMTYEDKSSEDEFKKVEELTPQSRAINIVVKVVSKSEIREVVTRRDGSTHRVCDATVGDDTGTIILTLWDDAIENINDEETISIKNGYISLFRGSMHLNIGRYGSFEKMEEEVISEVNTENNLSEKTYEQPRRYPNPRFQSMYSDRDSDRRRSYGRRR